LKDDILLVLKLEISYRVDVLYAYVQAQYQTRYLVGISISEPALVMLTSLFAQSIFLRKKIDDAQA
jgi:hypothetical protein